MKQRILHLVKIVLSILAFVVFLCWLSYVVNIHLGNRYLDKGLYPQALDAFHKAVRFNPDSPFLNYKLGLTYEKMDLPDQSLHFFLILLNQKQSHQNVSFVKQKEIFRHISELGEKLGDDERAIHFRWEILHMNDDDFEANLMLGKAYAKRAIRDPKPTDFADALKYFKRASEIDAHRITPEDQHLIDLIKLHLEQSPEHSSN